MRWIAALLILANIGLAVGVSYWSSPGKLDVDGGKLPRVSELKLDGRQTASELNVPEQGRIAGEIRDPKVENESALALKTGLRSEAEYRESGKCGRIEGFESDEQAERFIGSHETLIQGVSTVEQISPRPFYHWVLVPPLGSRSAALERLEELQRAGVDSYLVTEGEYSNAISLGLFESEKLAQDLNARFQSRNVETVLVNKDRNQISYALVFEVANAADLDRLAAAARRYAGDLKSVGTAPCEGVASPDKNP
ncbi:SPOR domain-containing protein [Marinobacter fonticola]|uniref:SPOR domain-containing protein n=1 Tax=Marinobacter fonticola TaxID=2603215 RepID=UPI0011E88E85|nr:SPOR domain-containing protein [Marinobacter fonticola]